MQRMGCCGLIELTNIANHDKLQLIKNIWTNLYGPAAGRVIINRPGVTYANPSFRNGAAHFIFTDNGSSWSGPWAEGFVETIKNNQLGEVTKVGPHENPVHPGTMITTYIWALKFPPDFKPENLK